MLRADTGVEGDECDEELDDELVIDGTGAGDGGAMFASWKRLL